jgi:hypothetical protein
MACSHPSYGEVQQFAEEVRRKSRSDNPSKTLGQRKAVDWVLGDESGKYIHPFTQVPSKTWPSWNDIARTAEEAKKVPGSTYPPADPVFCTAVQEVLTWLLGSSSKPKI